MTRFSVDIDDLRAVARTLGGVRDRLTHITSAMAALGGAATGHGRLAAALRDFGEDWEYSLGKIKEHAEGLEGMVIQAADTYRDVDSEVARAAGG